MRALGALLLIAIGACAATDRSGARPPRNADAAAMVGSVTLVVGPARKTRMRAMEPGLTMTEALFDGLLLGLGEAPHIVALERGGRRYTVDVEAVARGEHVDEPLEAGDTLVVDEDFPLKPASPQSLAAPSVSSSVDTRTCGELMLDEVAMRVGGRGENHPAVVALRKTLLTRCAESDAGASLVHACRAAWIEREEDVGRGFGAAHPRIRALDAELAICPPLNANESSKPPDAAECVALREKRQALSRQGKGAKHPEVVALDAQIDLCH